MDELPNFNFFLNARLSQTTIKTINLKIEIPLPLPCLLKFNGFEHFEGLFGKEKENFHNTNFFLTNFFSVVS